MEAMPLAHAGDRSFERDMNWAAVQHVVKHGAQTQQDNGNIKHVGYHKSDTDHEYTVVTTPHPKHIVTVFKNYKPLEKLLSERQQREKAEASARGAEKERANTTARRQALQREKKRLRSAKNNNKNTGK
jgi:hypothetical protein